MSLGLIILFQFEIKNEGVLQDRWGGNAGGEACKRVGRSSIFMVVGCRAGGQLGGTIAIQWCLCYRALQAPAACLLKERETQSLILYLNYFCHLYSARFRVI